MSDELTVEEKLRANAELVISTMRDQFEIDLTYNHASVKWLDDYIDRNREKWPPEIVDGLVSTLGSFLGECIIQTYGGAWRDDDGQWAVRFDDRNAAYPINKIRKHIENGSQDSVLSFFESIPVVCKMAT